MGSLRAGRRRLKAPSPIAGERLRDSGTVSNLSADDHFRTFRVSRDDQGALKGILTTEQPVDMIDWHRGELVPEVLVAGGMRIRGGADQVPLLDSHDSGSTESVLGSVRGIATANDADRSRFPFVEGGLKFASDERSQVAKKKVDEGHVTDLSVGYRTDEGKTLRAEEGETVEHDGVKYAGPVMVRTEWTLNETSLVPIGADTEAKVRGFKNFEEAIRGLKRTPAQGEKISESEDGRSNGGDPVLPDESAGRAETEPLDEKTTETATGEPGARTSTIVFDMEEKDIKISEQDVEKAVEARLQAEQDRVATILELGEKVGDGEWARGLIRDGVTVEEARQKLIEEHWNAKPIAITDQPAELGLSKKEKRGYSMLRGIKAQMEGKRVEGLEGEASRALAEQCGREPRGFFVPTNDLDIDTSAARQQRDLLAISGNVGDDLVETTVHGDRYIELLRARTLVRSLGAQVLSGLQGDVLIPAASAAATAAWVAENSAISESGLTTTQKTASPKELGVYSEYSKKLLAQSEVGVEALIRDDMMKVISIAEDDAYLEGASGGNNPTGIFNTSGVATSSVASAGSPTHAEIVEFETDVAGANALGGNLAYVTTPAVVGNMKTTRRDSGSGIFLIEDGITNGYPVYATTSLTANRIIFGNFADTLICEWGGLDVTVDPLSKNEQRLVRIVAFKMCDFIVRHAASFSVSA